MGYAAVEAELLAGQLADEVVELQQFGHTLAQSDSQIQLYEEMQA
jgi:ATP phosphoribosyltransferase